MKRQQGNEKPDFLLPDTRLELILRRPTFKNICTHHRSKRLVGQESYFLIDGTRCIAHTFKKPLSCEEYK